MKHLCLSLFFFSKLAVSLLLVNNLDSCTLVCMHAKDIIGGFAWKTQGLRQPEVTILTSQLN